MGKPTTQGKTVTVEPNSIPDVEVRVAEVLCGECNSSLEFVVDNEANSGDIEITALPCDVCLEVARDEAKENGVEEGYEAGRESKT